MRVEKIEVIRTLGMITFAFSLIFALAAATLASLYTLRGLHPPAPLYIVQGQVADNIANEVAKVYAKVQELYGLAMKTANPQLLRLFIWYRYFAPMGYVPQLIFLFALPNALIGIFTCIATIPLRMVLIYHPPLPITIIDISIGVFTQALADLWFIDTVYHTATSNSLISTVWKRVVNSE
jgi:hypothetical protein